MALHLRSKPKNTWEGRVDRWSAGWMGLIHPRWCQIELPCNRMLTMFLMILWRSLYSWIISETYRITSNHLDSNSNHTKWITVLARSHKPSLIRVSSNSTREAHFASPRRDPQDFSLPDTPYSTDRGHFHFCEAARTGDLSTVLLTAFMAWHWRFSLFQGGSLSGSMMIYIIHVCVLYYHWTEHVIVLMDRHHKKPVGIDLLVKHYKHGGIIWFRNSAGFTMDFRTLPFRGEFAICPSRILLYLPQGPAVCHFWNGCRLWPVRELTYPSWNVGTLDSDGFSTYSPFLVVPSTMSSWVECLISTIFRDLSLWAFKNEGHQ